MRRSWIQIDGELVPKDEYVAPTGVIIMPDIKPYKSMVTGEMIGSRSTHRNHLRQHGMIEVGNEKPKTRPISDVPGLREDLSRVVYGR